jgi:hypothetical protein
MYDNPYVVLIRCITALYLINKTPGNWTDIKKTIKETLTYIELPTATIGDGSDGIISINLRSMADWMLSVEEGIDFNKEDILGRIRINLRGETSYLNELELSISIEGDEDRSRKRIRSINSELKFDLNKQRIKKLVARMNHRINFSASGIDTKEAIRELQENLAKYNVDPEGSEKAGFVGRLITTDLEAMEKVFETAKEVNSPEGLLRTGFVGLNRMAGGIGLRRGELINVGALTHNYKTGMLNDLARQVPLYNTPFMFDVKKKPLVLRVSFENKLEQDLPIIYKSLIEQETGEKITLSEIDQVKAAQYIKNRLEVNGYKFGMECYDPNNFDVYDLIDLISKYEADGYELHLLVVDYMELIVNIAKSADRRDEAINDAFQVIRNHCFPKGITVVTAHQLSTEAQQLAREGTANFAEKVSTGGYYRNTKSLHTKLDLEIITHIVKLDGVSYLTVARGKHRGGEDTPEKHRTYFQPFAPVGGLLDDVMLDVPLCMHGPLTSTNVNRDSGESVSSSEDQAEHNDDPW